MKKEKSTNIRKYINKEKKKSLKDIAKLLKDRFKELSSQDQTIPLLSNSSILMIIDSLINILKEYTVDGYEINISGFGKFKLVPVKAKTMRNPQTHESFYVPEKMRVKFIAAKAFKECANCVSVENIEVED